MKVTVEAITPTQASEWLARNDHNRTLKKVVVDRLAAAITRGEWAMNGESIKFNGETLLDGQHRLAAIVAAGLSVESVVVRGVAAAAQETMDLGTRRSLADVLRIRHETNANMLAGALIQLFMWRSSGRLGRTHAATYPTVQQATQLLDNEPNLRTSLRVGSLVKQHLPFPPSLAVTMHYIFASIEPEDGDDFWERLATGARLTESEPIFSLRRLLLDNQAPRRFDHRLDKERLAAITVKAWNAYRRGETIQRLGYRPGGAHPETFPVPV